MLNLDGLSLGIGAALFVLGLVFMGVGGVVSAFDDDWKGVLFYVFIGVCLVVGGYLQIGYALELGG